jgi:transposase
MGKVSIIELVLAKNVWQAHGAGADGSVVFRRKLTRVQLQKFMAAQAPCVVAMETCASSHHWGRAIGYLGHEVRLIPPAYVKPFVKRQKNDMADAEAIAHLQALSRYGSRRHAVGADLTCVTLSTGRKRASSGGGNGLPRSSGPVSVLVHDGS